MEMTACLQNCRIFRTIISNYSSQLNKNKIKINIRWHSETDLTGIAKKVIPVMLISNVKLNSFIPFAVSFLFFSFLRFFLKKKKPNQKVFILKSFSDKS